MQSSNRGSAAAMAIAIMVAFAAALSATTAHAQIKATNSSGCTVLLTLVDAGGNLAGPYVVPSGSIATTITTPAGFVAVGVEDVNGRTRRFTGTPAPGCTGCIPLPAQGVEQCCVNVCYDSTAQTITISACSPCQ